MRVLARALVAVLALTAACVAVPASALAATTVASVSIDHALTAGDEAGPGDVVHVALQRAPDDKPAPVTAVYWGDLPLPVAVETPSATGAIVFTIPSSARTDEGPWTAVRAQQRRQALAPLTVASADGTRSGTAASLRLYFPAIVRAVSVRNGAGRAATPGDTLDLTLDEGALRMLRQRPAAARSPLGLFVDGRSVGGSLVDGVAPDTVTIALDRRDDNRAAWRALLDARPHVWQAYGAQIALGTSDAAEQTTAHALSLSPWGARPVWVLLALAAVIAGALVVLLRSDLARDLVNPPVGRAPYSLGRAQLFVWVANVMLAAVAVWLETGDTAFPGGLLVALGIGGGTTLGSRVVDKSVWSEALEAHRDALRKAIAAAEQAGDAPTAARLQHELDEATARHIHPKAPASEGFLRDILTGVEGDALYRYQLVAWTALVMAQFWVAVLSHVELPDLDTAHLALMGMSAGTYLGLKLPEKPPV
jgi:hypothetical protein